MWWDIHGLKGSRQRMLDHVFVIPYSGSEATVTTVPALNLSYDPKVPARSASQPRF